MRCLQHVVVCTLSAVLFFSLIGKSSAQQKLQWKFTEGEQLEYDITQKLTMEMSFGAQDVTTVVNQDMEMVNTVQSVGDDGAAAIEQQIRHLVMTMELPGSQKVTIDSAAEEEPEHELAKSMMPLLKRLAKAKFTFKMAPSGQVSDLTVPDDLFDKSDKSIAGQMMSKLFTKDSLKQIITQGSPVFPKEHLEVGDKWQQRYSVDNPIGLKQSVDNTFTYLGKGKGDDASLHKLGLEMLLEFSDAPEGGPKIEITNQDAQGSIYFDAAAGRMTRSSIDQSVEMKISNGGLEMNQKLRNELSVKVTPVTDK